MIFCHACTWLESMFLHFYFTCILGLIAYTISRVVSPGLVLPLMLCDNAYTHIRSHRWERRWFLGDIDFLSLIPFIYIVLYCVFTSSYAYYCRLIIADNRPGPLPFTRAIVYSARLMGFIMSQKIWPLSWLHISTSIDAIYVILFWFPQILIWVFRFYSPLFYFIYKSGRCGPG